jgi:hypothetical protein
MEKEFCPYEQALSLKELGFDVKCLAGFYTHIDENFVLNIYDYRGKLNINYSSDDDYIVNTDKKHYISAPLYQQAFRWFREKYALTSSVGIIYKDETRTDFEFWYYILGYEDEELFYETHEEAELECLKKLIKIVKENGKN